MPDRDKPLSEHLDASAPLTDATDADTPPTSSGTDEHSDPNPAATTDDTPEPTMADVIGEALETDPDADPKPSDDTPPNSTGEEGGDDTEDEDDADTPDADADADDGKDGEASTEEKDDDDADDESESEGDDADTDSADPSEEELKGMRPKVRKRIERLLNDRREARREAETHKVDADRYRAVRTYMDQNNLMDQEVADLFQVGADLKSGDPKRMQAFLDRVQPLVQQALEATGQAVPNDLRTQVDDGEMTEAAAQEVARHRYAAQRANAQAETTRGQVQQQQAQQTQNAVLNAVNDWTTQVQASDPDFDLKSGALRRVSQAIVAERGLPQTPDQAVQYAQEAYDEVTTMFRKANPRPKATRPQPSASATSKRSGVAPAPTSLEDVIGQALSG